MPSVRIGALAGNTFDIVRTIPLPNDVVVLASAPCLMSAARGRGDVTPLAYRVSSEVLCLHARPYRALSKSPIVFVLVRHDVRLMRSYQRLLALGIGSGPVQVSRPGRGSVGLQGRSRACVVPGAVACSPDALTVGPSLMKPRAAQSQLPRPCPVGAEPRR